MCWSDSDGTKLIKCRRMTTAPPPVPERLKCLVICPKRGQGFHRLTRRLSTGHHATVVIFLPLCQLHLTRPPIGAFPLVSHCLAILTRSCTLLFCPFRLVPQRSFDLINRRLRTPTDDVFYLKKYKKKFLAALPVGRGPERPGVAEITWLIVSLFVCVSVQSQWRDTVKWNPKTCAPTTCANATANSPSASATIRAHPPNRSASPILGAVWADDATSTPAASAASANGSRYQSNNLCVLSVVYLMIRVLSVASACNYIFFFQFLCVGDVPEWNANLDSQQSEIDRHIFHSFFVHLSPPPFSFHGLCLWNAIILPADLLHFFCFGKKNCWNWQRRWRTSVAVADHSVVSPSFNCPVCKRWSVHHHRHDHCHRVMLFLTT